MTIPTATYYVGSSARLTVEFFDATGEVPADPTVATIMVRTPGGVEASHVYSVDLGVVRLSAGVYYYDQTLTEASLPNGRDWFYRGKGTGAVVAAAEKRLVVQASRFAAP